MESAYWPQDYSSGVTTFERTRTVTIGDHKLPLLSQPQSHPIERFNYGEGPLPVGLINPVQGYQNVAPVTTLPDLTFSPTDPDAASWEGDSHSLSTRSNSQWNHHSQVTSMQEYAPGSLPMAFRHSGSPTPSDSSNGYRYGPSEVIDPNLTLNQQGLDYLGYKDVDAPVKFEFEPPYFISIEDGEYEPEDFASESPNGTHYHQLYDSNIDFNSNRWTVREVPVTRSQKHTEGQPESQGSSRQSSNGSSKSSRSPKTPLSPTSVKRINKRRGSGSSGEESPPTNGRPKKYNKKRVFFQCNESGCKDNRFKNRSELKKHIETQHTKPYICIFGFTGCKQRFGARNEWKRHIATQHLMLYKYVCDHTKCRDKPKAKILFNRGDLFMKHQERMHSPANIQDRKPDDPILLSWKDEMKAAKERCEELRPPPQRMTCGFCGQLFEKGDKSWQDLIDHVGLHYQHNDQETHKIYQNDSDIMNWMRDNNLWNDDDSMDVDSASRSPEGRKNRKRSYSSSSDSPSARQIKQEHQMEMA